MLLFLAAGDTRIEMSGRQLDVLSSGSAHRYRNLRVVGIRSSFLSDTLPCGFQTPQPPPVLSSRRPVGPLQTAGNISWCTLGASD